MALLLEYSMMANQLVIPLLNKYGRWLVYLPVCHEYCYVSATVLGIRETVEEVGERWVDEVNQSGC